MLADMQFDEMTKWSQNIQQVHMHNMFATCSSALPFASAVSVCNLMFPTAPLRLTTFSSPPCYPAICHLASRCETSSLVQQICWGKCSMSRRLNAMPRCFDGVGKLSARLLSRFGALSARPRRIDASPPSYPLMA